jgi:hypothetical protein
LLPPEVEGLMRRSRLRGYHRPFSRGRRERAG